jgi:hypothetical protein
MRLNLSIDNKIILGSAPTLTLVNPLFLIFSGHIKPIVSGSEHPCAWLDLPSVVRYFDTIDK